MRNTRVNEIDLLRFLAALAVVFFHYAFRGHAADGLSAMPYPLLAPVAKYGYLGVDLFFMISGFVILMSAAGGGLRAFLVSRVVRLYPAFWACCTITAVLMALLGSTVFDISLQQYLLNLTMLSEFAGVPSVDGSYWSLFVEIKFYALVVVVLIARWMHRVLPLMACWLLAAIVLEIAPSYTVSSILVASYAAYFVAGATFFLIWSQGISRSKVSMLAASWALAIYQSLRRSTEAGTNLHTELDGSAVVAIVTSFFIILFLVATRRTGPIGRGRWALAGSLTYPLYLLHQNIGYMIFNLAYPALDPHLVLWGTFVLVLALAFAVHVLIEKRYSAKFRHALNGAIDTVRRRKNGGGEAPAVPCAPPQAD